MTSKEFALRVLPHIAAGEHDKKEDLIRWLAAFVAAADFYDRGRIWPTNGREPTLTHNLLLAAASAVISDGDDSPSEFADWRGGYVAGASLADLYTALRSVYYSHASDGASSMFIRFVLEEAPSTQKMRYKDDALLAATYRDRALRIIVRLGLADDLKLSREARGELAIYSELLRRRELRFGFLYAMPHAYDPAVTRWDDHPDHTDAPWRLVREAGDWHWHLYYGAERCPYYLTGPLHSKRWDVLFLSHYRIVLRAMYSSDGSRPYFVFWGAERHKNGGWHALWRREASTLSTVGFLDRVLQFPGQGRLVFVPSDELSLVPVGAEQLSLGTEAEEPEARKAYYLPAGWHGKIGRHEVSANGVVSHPEHHDLKLSPGKDYYVIRVEGETVPPRRGHD